jgi:putative redox protein
MEQRTAYLKLIEGLAFVGKGGSGHWLAVDFDRQVGGTDGANRPKELLLLALGTCAGSTVADILRKKKLDIKSFEVLLSGEVREERPKVFTRIDVEFAIHGRKIPPDAVEQAIALTEEKYCSISAMLSATVPIKFTYRIVSA